MRRIQGSEIAVTKDDQANINTFSRLYSKNQDNQGVLEGLNQKITSHKDTIEQLELYDNEETVRFRFGMCFFTLTCTPKIIQLKKPDP